VPHATLILDEHQDAKEHSLLISAFDAINIRPLTEVLGVRFPRACSPPPRTTLTCRPCCHAVLPNYFTYQSVIVVYLSYLEDIWNRFRRWIEKSDIFKPSRFEPLYQPYFGFWLFAWSRCGRIVKKSSREDSWYQDYSVILTSAPPSCHRQPSAFVPEIARNIWKQAVSILVERPINQNIEVLLFG